MFTGVMANATVTDPNRAREWYTTLFGREPDSVPMGGLLEWHLAPGSGVQVWAEPDRGGRRILRIADPDGNRIVFAGE